MVRLVSALMLVLASLLVTSTGQAQTPKIKIFIRADSTSVNGQRFADKDFEDTANDMRKRLGSFELAKDEADADLLFVVIKRDDQTGKTGGLYSRKIIAASISTRDGASWKPATVLTKSEEAAWSLLAHDLMGDANKWAKTNFKK